MSVPRFETLALIALLLGWLMTGFIAWLPWVAVNGPNRPLARLSVALGAALLGALALPLAGVRGVPGLAMSPLAAFAAASLASFLAHRRLRPRGPR